MGHHRQVGRVLCLVGAVLVLAGACAPPQEEAKAAPVLRPAVNPATPPEFAAVNDPDLIKLKEALIEGTAEALMPYFEHPGAMAPGGQLAPQDLAYLRGESQGRTGPLNPVREILKEPVVVLATQQPQPQGSWIVVFVPANKEALLKSSEFLETGWLSDYFACWVDRVDGRVRIIENFCFNETGGPYPADD